MKKYFTLYPKITLISILLILFFIFFLLIFFEHQSLKKEKQDILYHQQSIKLLNTTQSIFQNRCRKIHIDIYKKKKTLHEYETLIHRNHYWLNLISEQLTDKEVIFFNQHFKLHHKGSLLRDSYQLIIQHDTFPLPERETILAFNKCLKP